MKNTAHQNNIIILAVSLFVFSCLIILGMVQFGRHNTKRITLNNREHLIETANNLAETVADELQNGYININNLASLLSRSLTSEDVDVSYLQTLLSNSVFDFIEYADSDGMDHNITGGISNARDRQYYKEAMKGNSGMELINKSRATFETLYMFYSPVYFNGKIIGSLVGVYQAKNRMRKILNMHFYGDKAPAYLCTPNGRIVGTTAPLDTTSEFYLQDLYGYDPEIRKVIVNSLKTGQASVFAHNSEEVGGYITPLPESDYFLALYFPENANETMLQGSQFLVYKFVIYMVLLLIVFSVIDILFYSRQQKLVESASKAKSVFLLNMSHDIRTPMNAILGFTALATKHIDDKEKVLDYHKKINSSGENLLSLINDVLDMSRIESGRTMIKTEPNDLITIVDDLATIVQPQCESKKITFTVEKKNISNEYIHVDRTHLNQILLNLLGNAVKFTPENGHILFSIKQIADSNDYTFVIRDSGIGMSLDFMDKLYKPFEREQTSTVNRIQGTGLGLSITKKLVDLMKGTIEVDSKAGFGTTFTVTLPFKPAAKDPLWNTQPQATLSNVLKGKKVLVADDNMFNMEITTEILKDEGCIVASAENGYEALKMIKASEPGDYDLILMDIQMPVMNGIESAQEIRKLDPPLNNIPIIALSANVFEEDVKKTRDAGIEFFISKPVKVPDLIGIVSQICNSDAPRHSELVSESNKESNQEN